MRETFLVTDKVPQGFLEKLESLGFATHYIEKMDTDSLAPVVHEYHGIVINTSMLLDKAMLDKALKLKYILRPGSGLDNIDAGYAAEKNILVLNSPEGNSHAVAEHALGMLLGLLNYIPRAWQQVQEFKWIRHENTGTELRGKTVGIIGYGNTGSAFARKLSGFGTQILVYDKYKKDIKDSFASRAEMADIYELADVVSLHIPLNTETRHLVNDTFISNFVKPVYLLNTSRGGIVQAGSIIKALQQGKLLGAGLDVLENEKIASYNDREKQELQTLMNAGNIIITPHIAGWTKEAREKIFNIVLEKFTLWLQSKISG